MAHIYKRRDIWWIQYRVDGVRVRESWETTNERVARDHKKDIEAMGRTGQLRRPSCTPLRPLLQSFCTHLKATCTPDGWSTDLSWLRGFFGPCVEALHLGSHVPKKFRREPTAAAAVQGGAGGMMRIGLSRLEDLTAL